MKAKPPGTGSREALERVLAALVQARRALQLYPRANPLVNAALEKLSAALRPTGAAGNQEVIACEVRADGFYLEELRLCDSRKEVERFALLLYREGAKVFRFEPGARLEEALDFLDAFQELEAGKTSSSVRLRLGAPRIGVEIFSTAIVTSGAAEEAVRPDVLSYLVAARQRRLAEGRGGSHLHDVLGFLVAAEQGNELEQVLLLNALADAEKMAQALSYVVHGAEPGNDPISGAAHALQQTLKHIEICTEEFPRELREDFLAHLGEAVLGTDSETRNTLLNAVLPPHVGTGGLETELLGYLPPRYAASVLLRHVQLHEGTVSTVQGFLGALPPRQAGRVLELFLEGMSKEGAWQEPAERIENFRSLLPQRKPARTPPPPEDAKPEVLKARQQELTEVLRQALVLSPAETETVRLEVARTNDRLDEQQDTLTFFYLFALGTLAPDPHMMEWLQRTLLKAVEERDFAFANHVLQLALGNVRPDVSGEAFPALQAYLSALYGSEGMSAFLNHLAAESKKEGDHPPHDALEAIATDAAPALFQRLETEVAKQRRFDLLRLFLDMGPTVKSFLREQVSHPHWFVVRNAVYLLGRLPDEENLPALTLALAHREPRVRSEAVRAFGTTPGRGRAALVMRLLSDPEPALRAQAAEVLGQIGDPSAAAALAEQLRRRWRLRRNPDYALSLLQAVGQLGGPECVAPLRAFLRSLLLPGTRQRPQLRSVGRWAMEQVLARDGVSAAAGGEALVHERE